MSSHGTRERADLQRIEFGVLITRVLEDGVYSLPSVGVLLEARQERLHKGTLPNEVRTRNYDEKANLLWGTRVEDAQNAVEETHVWLCDEVGKLLHAGEGRRHSHLAALSRGMRGREGAKTLR